MKVKLSEAVKILQERINNSSDEVVEIQEIAEMIEDLSEERKLTDFSDLVRFVWDYVMDGFRPGNYSILIKEYRVEVELFGLNPQLPGSRGPLSMLENIRNPNEERQIEYDIQFMNNGTKAIITLG